MTGFNSKRQAAQPQAEPVAWMYDYMGDDGDLVPDLCTDDYTHTQPDNLAKGAKVTNIRPLYLHPAAPVPAVLPDCTEDDARGLRLVGPHGGVMGDIPNPTDAELASPLFEAIWQATKTWDVNVPEYYKGYCGMSGSHVVMILRAIAAAPAVQSAARAIAAEQAEDTGLWFIATTVSEAHLQAALRRLTAAIEGEAPVALTPLTNEQIWALATNCTIGGDPHIDKFARAVEQYHGIGDKT
jgi:hypothetical protein